MKTKLTTGCLKEMNGLRVCQKSTTIIKDSPSHVRISHQAAEFETGTRNEQKGDEANYNDSINGETIHSQKQLSSSTNYAGVGKGESTPSTCTSNVDTIFSPILESIDIRNEFNVHNNGGGIYTKGLTVLGVDLAKAVIIDNPPQVDLSYATPSPFTAIYDHCS